MHVKQAANVVRILEYFAKRKRPATLSEISDDLNWPRSSTFNLLGTLVDCGYLYEPRARGAYYPTPKWLISAQSVSEAEPLPESLETLTSTIAQRTGETTAIGGQAGSWATFLYVAESSNSVRYFAKVGDRVPLHASSVGRALLAQHSPDERRSIYRKIDFQRYSDTAPLTVEAVEGELAAAKERGYHQSLGEFVPDLAGVAIGLPIPSRRLAIVVAGPVSRCLDRRSEIAEFLMCAAREFLG